MYKNLIFILIAFVMTILSAQAQVGALTTVVQQGHKVNISNVAYRQDGKNFVSYSSTDQTAMLWSAQGQLIRILPLSYQVTLEFTPDGNFLIGKDQLYDLNGNKIREFSPGSNNGVSCSKLSPDGKIVALGLDNTNIPNKRKIRLVDINGNFIRLLDGTNHTAKCIAFSPDGKTLAVGAGSVNPQEYIVGQQEPLDPTVEVVLMDLNGTILKKLTVDKDVKAITFSPDGQKVVAILDNGKIMNWKVDGTLISETTVGGGNLSDVAYSPDNKYFVVGGYSILALYDPDGTLVRTFRDKTNGYDTHAAATNCRFSPDSKYILTNNNADILIWNTNGSVIKKIPAFNSAQLFTDAKITHKGDYFYAGSVLWSMEGRRIILPASAYSYKFSDDAKYAATVEYVKNDQGIWSNNAIVMSIDGSSRFKIEGISPERFSDGGLIAESDDKRKKKYLRFDLKGKLIDSVNTKNPEIYSPDKKYYLTSSYKGVNLFDASGKVLKSFYNTDSASIKDKEVYAKHGGFFSPDGKVMAKHVARGVQLYEIPSGKLLGEISTVTVLNGGYEINDGAYGNGMGSGKIEKIFFSKDSKNLFVLGFFRLNAFNLEGKQVLHGPDNSDLQGSFPDIGVSNDDKYMIAYFGQKKLARISMENGNILATSRKLETTVSFVSFTPDWRLLLTKDDNGSMRLFNPETLEEIVSFYALGDNDYAIVTPDGYYSASKNAGRYMHFSKELKTFTFDNFDLIYNRPDIIVDRMGFASDEMVDGLKKAYLKRLKKMGFTEDQVSLDVHLPEVEMLTKEIPPVTESKFLNTQLKVKDSKYLLDRINVYVNEVPLYGSQGMSLKELKTSEVTREIKVELVNGRNVIQYAVMNEKGAESIKETVEINYTGIEVKPVLHVVSIGVSDYADNIYDLKYAAKDASDLAALLVANKTKFADVKVLKILDATATKDNIRKAKDFLNLTRVDDQVVLFVAGHGLLDDDMNFYFATSNVDFNNPKALGLPYEDLEGLLDGIPARKKLMLIDACHSGEVDKEETIVTSATVKASGGSVASRGFKTVQRKESVGLKSSFELMQELFADLRKGSGAMVISSASGVEFAFESDTWKNGVFTYSLLESLKSGSADLNKDNSIYVSELRDYVIKKVGELTNGKQHPTSRKESLEFDFKVW